MIEIASLLAFLLIAFCIGSNDTSNAFGICIGCRIVSIRKATILLFVLALLGLTLQGERVIKTVGKDLVATSSQISAVALVIASLIVVLANLRGFPVSTHQVIVGSLSGTAVAFGTPLSLKTLLEILLSWLLSPLLAGFLAILTFLSLERLLKSLGVLRVERTLRFLLLCSGSLVAYNMGANELATAVAPLGTANFDHISAILGATAIFLGAIVMSRRIAEKLCKGITSIDPKTGFSAQFGAGLSVYTFTILGMPVSTTYSLVGGITAVGLLKGVRTVKVKTLRDIALNWISAPVLAFALSFIASKILLRGI